MARLHVEVVYALAGVQDVVPLQLAEGSNAAEAVRASGLAARHGLAAHTWVLGISGRRVAPGTALHDGDRVEILRPLAVDPNEGRRRRAQKARRA
jgi:putative ubiquitin-RnfH superfamily antitoxin RatB of RatAB toxin-antitoxin module